jgi:carboxylesterase
VPIDALASPLSAAARPEFTAGRRIGVLLSHGFTGSPASIKPWGEALAARGYAVEVPRLPGHGTTWRELNTTTWADWYGEIQRGFDKLVAENDVVVLCGLSMGGALVLRLAADRPDQVAGVVVVNPAVGTERKDVLLLPVLKHLIPSFPGIANDIKKPGVEEHGYTKTPLRAAASMFAAFKQLRTDLPQVMAPMLYLRSSVDHVVDGLSERVILSRISSRDVTKTMLEDSYHVATLDNDAPMVFAASADFIARVTTGQ